MLKDVIEKANLILKDAQQRLTIQSVDAVEKIFISIENLNKFINNKMDQIESHPKLGYRERSNARRVVLEQAGRKLEKLKDRSNYSTLIQASEAGISDDYEKDDNILLKFMREREIRDRLFGMTETQILSHFGESLFDGSNQQLLDAILNASPGFEMLSEPNLRKLRRVKTTKLTAQAGVVPDNEQDVNALIVDIFTLAKKELDHLRNEELAGIRT